MRPYSRISSHVEPILTVKERFDIVQNATLLPDLRQWSTEWPRLAAALGTLNARDPSQSFARWGFYGLPERTRAVLRRSGYPESASCITGARGYAMRSPSEGEDAAFAADLLA